MQGKNSYNQEDFSEKLVENFNDLDLNNSNKGLKGQRKAFVPKGKFALNQNDFGGGLDDIDSKPAKIKSKGKFSKKMKKGFKFK